MVMQSRKRRRSSLVIFIGAVMIGVLGTSVAASHYSKPVPRVPGNTVTTVGLFDAQRQYMECLAPLGVRGRLEFDWAQGVPVYRFFSTSSPAIEIVEGDEGLNCHDRHVGDLEYLWADEFTPAARRGDLLVTDMTTCLRNAGFDMRQDSNTDVLVAELDGVLSRTPSAVGQCLDDVLLDR